MSLGTDDTAFIVFDIESIPDGELLKAVNYADEALTAEQAIDKARDEARAASKTGSDFIPYSFQTPIALCVVKVARNLQLRGITCLDAPLYRPREIVKTFWDRISVYTNNGARLVTFNGRRFDIPLLELCAFRYGLAAGDHFANRRDRYKTPDIDIYDLLGNKGATAVTGGLSLLAKMIGKPGKMGFSGEKVYDAYREGKLREINDYCVCDVLDTYFVFLRMQVIQGMITNETEAELNRQAREYLVSKADEFPVLTSYLSRWTEM
ncbi:3'-5' exonuclease [soil metagenome]